MILVGRSRSTGEEESLATACLHDQPVLGRGTRQRKVGLRLVMDHLRNQGQFAE